jgi:DNA polymerase III epsilon subunit-like protein
MSEGAKKITNFSDEKYNRLAIDPAPILQLLDSQIYNPDVLIVGQNILGFDIYVHNGLRKKLGFKSDYSYLPRVLDTKCLSKAKNLEIACSGDRILWQMRMNSVNSKKAGKNSQGAMLKELGIPHDTTRLHDSLYDVQMTWKIYKKLINMVEI